MSPVCRIDLLGGMRLVVGGRAVERFRTRKAALLLAYLALHPDRPHSRELLAELLWPESAPERGRHSLNVALSSLRDVLEGVGAARESALAADRETICLRAAVCEIDVARFEAALAAAGAAEEGAEQARLLEEALSIYGGALLPDLEEPWVATERRRLEEAARAARERLALLRSAPAAPSSSGFFGREEEIARLRALFAEGKRLITLTGPGGSGKTRLAREAAERLAPLPRVAWASLAAVTDPRLLGDALLQALEAPPDGSAGPLERVAVILAGRPTLLILDNYEQLLAGPPEEAAAARDFVRDLLARAPAATCLVTSRRRLDLEEETELLVPPLPVPDLPPALLSVLGPTPPVPLGEPALTPLTPLSQLWERGVRGVRAGPTGEPGGVGIAASPAVRLFVDRTRRVRPEFRLTLENAAAICGICRRLEGLPLALELAAARATALAPAQILAHLEERLDLLATRQRDAEPRHRSLRTAFEWSLRLLSDEEQALFARLSVFRGGWTEEMAEAVCGGSRGLAALARSSLALCEETETGPRFRFLEPIREFAAEQLAARGETDAMRRRHADHFAALAEANDPMQALGRQVEAMKRLSIEVENLRAALAWCQERLEARETGLRLGASLGEFWHLRYQTREGLRWLQPLVEGADHLPPALWARALETAGCLTRDQGHWSPAHDLLQRGLSLARSHQDREREAWILFRLGKLGAPDGSREVACRYLEASLALFRQLDHPQGIARAAGWLTFDLSVEPGEPPHIRPLAREGLALARQAGDLLAEPVLLDVLGRLARRSGDLDEAYRCSSRLLELAGEFDLPGMEAMALSRLGRVRFDQGAFREARALLTRSLALHQQIGDLWQIGALNSDLGDLAFRAGDWEEARRRYEESLAIRRQLGFRGGILWCVLMLTTLGRRRGDLAGAGTREEEARRVWVDLEPHWQREFLHAYSGWRREVIDAVLGDPAAGAEGSPSGPENTQT